MKEQSIIKFNSFDDKLPDSYREILVIYYSDMLKKFTCHIQLYIDELPSVNVAYWCYTSDLINTITYENKINEVLFSLADDKSISVNIEV